MKKMNFAAAALAATSLIATPAYAYPASRLSDLEGARAAGAESELERRGFTYIAGEKDRRGSHTYWWHDKDDNCVHVVTNNGRYTSITDASRPDCHRSENSDVGTALAVGAGVAILGALIAGNDHHKKHHREGSDCDDRSQRGTFQRGYSDGLHNNSYHNYDDERCYREGYEKGVDQREDNSRHHHRRGGYTPAASWQDLVGARASAIDQLSNRGFRQVDNFVSGDARYTIWWRGQSRQCLQVITYDGRLENISDIGQHPRCR